MRVYRLQEFLTLPSGTLYCKGEQWWFGELQVKGDTIGCDWACLHLNGIDAEDSGELFHRYEVMLETGASYPIEDAYGRDGCFDDAALFLVFEADDLKVLRATIENALAVTSGR